MKKILLFGLLLSFWRAEGQLLKKLKEKATQAIENNGNTDNKPSKGDKKEGSTKENGSNTPEKEKWQPTAGCNKLFTLAAGEYLLYDETKVFTSNDQLNTAFVVANKKYEYFLIENGQRSGPFNEPPLKQMNIQSAKKLEEDEAGNHEDESERITIGDSKRDPIAQQYSKTINNKLYIVFNGKNFGPYDYVSKMKLSPDKKRFWAVVTIGGNAMMAKMGMGNAFLVNEAAVKQKAGGENSVPIKLAVSQHFGAAVLSVMDNGGKKIMSVSSTGKKQEGDIAAIYSADGSMEMVSENGDLLSVPGGSPTQLLVNGTEAAVFKVPVKSLSRLFILKDFRQSVYYQGGMLYRGDGSEEKLSGIVFPKFAVVNGQSAMFYFKVHQTETGDKDVYVCQKAL
jgi:hypothetical protein